MSDKTRFLHRQLETYADAWNDVCEREMACWDLELRLRLGRELFHLINRANRQREREIGDDRGQLRDDGLRDLDALIRKWYRPAKKAMGQINALQAKWCHVRGAESLTQSTQPAEQTCSYSFTISGNTASRL